MAQQILDRDALDRRLTDGCDHYEKTAPTVAAYLDALYARLGEAPDSVRLVELLAVERLVEDGVWMHPALAANTVYKLMARLGMDTTGHAGF